MSAREPFRATVRHALGASAEVAQGAMEHYAAFQQQLGIPITVLTTIKTYPTLFEAEAAKIALDVADIPSVVVGVGVSMHGGMAGVQLQVPSEHVDAALEMLQES